MAPAIHTTRAIHSAKAECAVGFDFDRVGCSPDHSHSSVGIQNKNPPREAKT
jgi:hypothetical protein